MLDEAYERYGETNEAEEKVPRKRALELERKKEIELANELTLNKQFSIIVNDNREKWLDRAN